MKLQLLFLLVASCASLAAEPWKPPADAAETALSDAESERYQALTSRIIRSANERTELSDGFRYVLTARPLEPAEVIEWMRLERRTFHSSASACTLPPTESCCWTCAVRRALRNCCCWSCRRFRPDLSEVR
ncbi:MAG: hypothetical protein QM757_05755 [Paludibaculum sp.]